MHLPHTLSLLLASFKLLSSSSSLCFTAPTKLNHLVCAVVLELHNSIPSQFLFAGACTERRKDFSCLVQFLSATSKLRKFQSSNSKRGFMAGTTNFMDELDSANFFDQIDDLLDFPTDDFDSSFLGGCGNGDAFLNASPTDALLGYDSAFAAKSASDLSAELSVPYEDIVQLEWLSNFVEDSFSGGGMTIENNNLLSANDPSHAQFQTSSPVSVLESSSSSSNKVMNLISHEKKARTKRPRPTTFNPRPTIQLISPSLSSLTTETPSSESGAESQPFKKKKIMKKKAIPIPSNPIPQPLRKCMHCEITKTPQWRAGPMGPKTLCNACGVRFKTGRLFPEYRPAASPTFVPTVHSNSHKKVLEMRNTGCTENPN